MACSFAKGNRIELMKLKVSKIRAILINYVKWFVRSRTMVESSFFKATRNISILTFV